ncbi:MAG: hypothetical protein IID45_06240 [Planctomycetes bacterium]|nr:hypothetical protein [Planctomycetota bacterium]
MASSFSTKASDAPDRSMEQIASLEYILLGDLRDLLEEPPDNLTCKWLTAVLDALLDTMPQGFALQEDGGYMSDVLDIYPNWSGQVSQLLEERETLFGKLETLRERLADRESFRKVADELRRDLRDWMNSLGAFHRHERRLLQTAFNLDVGVCD